MIAGAIKVLEIYTHDISTVKSNFRMNEKKILLFLCYITSPIVCLIKVIPSGSIFL